MRAEGGSALRDGLLRSFGLLANCARIDLRELIQRTADAKLAIALGFLQGSKRGEELMLALAEMLVALRPANINRLNGRELSEEEQNEFRAARAGETVYGLKICSTSFEA